MLCPDDLPEAPVRSEDRPDTLLALFEKNHARMLAFVRWRSTPALAARRDPEDVLQAAFLRASGRWGSFEKSGMAFRPWFCRVVLDTLFDDHDFHAAQQRDYHAEAAWPDRSSMQLDMGLQNPATTPSKALMRKELREKVDHVLAQLPAKLQEIMVLIHFGELSKAQAARFVGIKSGTARKRYANARMRFREIWIDCYGQEELA